MSLTRVLVTPGGTLWDDRPPAELAVTDQLIAAAIIAEEVIGLDVLDDATQRRRPRSSPPSC
jgi:hypothetical protein